jgi:hypothetical protein
MSEREKNCFEWLRETKREKEEKDLIFVSQLERDGISWINIVQIILRELQHNLLNEKGTFERNLPSSLNNIKPRRRSLKTQIKSST